MGRVCGDGGGDDEGGERQRRGGEEGKEAGVINIESTVSPETAVDEKHCTISVTPSDPPQISDLSPRISTLGHTRHVSGHM